MAELQFKFFSHTKINQALRFIALEFSRSKADSVYIELDKSRYVRIKPLIKSLLKGIFWKSDKLGIFLSLSFKTRVRAFYMILFYRNITIFSSDAEIIQIRNNISVFYLQLGVRVKFIIEGGPREKNNLLNEWESRKNVIFQNPKVRVPNLIKLINNRNITCYADEIIYGEFINWFGKKSEKVLKLLIESMFSYYKTNEISWRPFNEIHPVTEKKILHFIKSDKNSSFPSKDILYKKIICSSVHGDLSPGNLILGNEFLYVIDWELSKFGSIIGDLYKIMNRYPSFTKKIEEFFLDERSKIHKIDLMDCATFSEHMFLESFTTRKRFNRFVSSQQYLPSKDTASL